MASSPYQHRGATPGGAGRYTRRLAPAERSNSQAIVVLSLCTLLFIFTFFTVVTLHSATLLSKGQEDVFSIQNNAFIVNNRLKEKIKDVEGKVFDTLRSVKNYEEKILHNHWISEHIPLYQDNNDLYKQHLGADPQSQSQSQSQSQIPTQKMSGHSLPNLQVPDQHEIAGHNLEHNQPPKHAENEHIPALVQTADSKPNYVHKRAHSLQCEHDDLVTFWDAPTQQDVDYKSPYDTPGVERYVTFEPDVGGWNNIRMQMELVLVFAYATGRTLVLPPDQPMYLLDAGKGHQKAHSFIDFFPFDHIRTRMKVITMEEFMAKEAVTGNLRVYPRNARIYDPRLMQDDHNFDEELKVRDSDSVGEVLYPPGNKTNFEGTIREDRWAMWFYLRNVSALPTWKSMKEFLVIPPGVGVNVTRDFPPKQRDKYRIKREVFSAKRNAMYYDKYWHDQKVIHFVSKPELGFRLLEHFYTFIHFEDDFMDRFFKRFIRDYVHYIDVIFCKGAKIIHEIQKNHPGGYVSFHIRRGEFQYKVVKIPAEKILENVGKFLPEKTVAYVATDEKNKTFFKAFEERFDRVYYLNDFVDLVELKGINPNYLGMIDQVVCTRGEKFVGTWFSTFTGYITRMRGYLGYPDNTVYFGDKEHRDRYQKFEVPKFPFYMREWTTSWAHIDEDDVQEAEVEATAAKKIH